MTLRGLAIRSFAVLNLLLACGSSDAPADNGSGGHDPGGAAGSSAGSVAGSSGSAGSAAGSGGTSSSDASAGGGGASDAGGTNTGGSQIRVDATADASNANETAVAGDSGTDGVCHESGVPGPAFEAECLACAANGCERCVCTGCSQQLKTCLSTAGCPEITACIRNSSCTGSDCYCGTFDLAACASGQANGPCKAVILAAPLAHPPTLLNPSAGPASDAAAAIGTCRQSGQPCGQACAK